MRNLLFALMLSSPAWGAIALVRTPDFGGAAAGAQTISVVLSSNSTAGNLLVGIASGEGVTCVTATPTVTDSRGTSYSVVLKQLGTGAEVQWAFYGFAATSGANTVVIDWTATHSCVRGGSYVAEYSGIASPIDQSKSAGEAVGSTAADSGAMSATTNADDLLFCGVAAFAISKTFTAGKYDATNSYTIRAQQATVDSTVVGDAVVSSTGVYHCRMTISASSQWAAHALAFKASTTVTPVVHKVTQ